MPPDSGITFVIVQHLSPEFKSLMSELLSRGHTSMALHHVEHGMLLEPNSIYLIPPKKNVVIFQDKLHLIDFETSLYYCSLTLQMRIQITLYRSVTRGKTYRVGRQLPVFQNNSDDQVTDGCTLKQNFISADLNIKICNFM